MGGRKRGSRKRGEGSRWQSQECSSHSVVHAELVPSHSMTVSVSSSGSYLHGHHEEGCGL